ncbi:T-cell surface antigen CD2-like [Pimephales promelas]|uniref:T-cell surface antigen CD2-like n=1 Tax=Pimephales promelas TaxID=90988 RepID=UPI0019557DB1|nr:T-cell surface antigen CD2-like [Pimephales promelas]
MDCKHNLLLLFLCGFAALSVSTEACGTDLLVGTSCIIKRKTENKEKPPDIKWVHSINGDMLRWKGGKVKGTYEGVSMEEDGSLRLLNVSLKDTGKYTVTEFNGDGTEIGKREVEIKVYEKAPKPTVIPKCKDGNATLSCNIGNRKDLTVSWYKEDKKIQNDKNYQVLLSFTQIQEYKPYSCEAHNPVSKEKSESITVSCPGSGFGPGGKLFGFDFWVMVGILAGGGALLLLLICVLIICACKSCQQRTKRQEDEEELRLAVLTPDQNGTSRSKGTARGQPAPPVPQEVPMPCSPSPETPRNQTQPRAQIRARPPPPPQDEDEEDPPPLPQPRTKQHRNKRSQEPYRPME